MAQNVTINKTVFIQNNYYQAPLSQTVPPQRNMGVTQTLVTGVTGIFFGVAGKYLWDKYGISDKVKKITYKYFRNEDDEELRNMFLSAKRNNFANANHSANVSHSESITVNTNYSENNRSNNTNIAKEKTINNQQQTQSKADSFSDEQAKCSEVVESSDESMVSSPVQEKEANLSEQYTADMKCSPVGEQKNRVSTRQKGQRKTEKKIARGAVLYNPLFPPDLIKGFSNDLLEEALKALYVLCRNKLFQCSEDCFVYWFGGESSTPKKLYKRISCPKSRLALQYFMKQLYDGKFDKGQWEMVANVFKIKGKDIPVGDLGKNTDKVGDKDKQMIDDIIKQFKKEVKKIALSSIK